MEHLEIQEYQEILVYLDQLEKEASQGQLVCGD